MNKDSRSPVLLLQSSTGRGGSDVFKEQMLVYMFICIINIPLAQYVSGFSFVNQFNVKLTHLRRFTAVL